jgi:signal transduction histidine kinase
MSSVDARLVRLLDAVLAIAGDLEVDAVLARLVEVACDVVGARYGALGELDESGERLRAFVHHGLEDGLAERIGPLPGGLGVLGLLVREPRALRLDDLAAHPAASGIPAHHPPMRSVLGVPIEVRGEVWGNLYLTEKAGGVPFDEDDEELVLGLAAVAGSAIANARLLEESRRLSVVEERERIGRDLHDTVIQRLFAAGLGLQAALRQLGDGNAAARVGAAVDDIDLTIKEIRSTIFALQDDGEHARGVRARMLEVIDEVGGLLSAAPRVRFEGPIDTVVPDEVADQLVPVLREALTNVVRHAGATEVEVVLGATAEGVALTVRDDGSGIAGIEPTGGLGLANLRERARGLGGDLELSSDRGVGTVLVWRVPG